MQRAKKILKDVKSSFRDAANLMRGNFLVVTICMSLWSAFWAVFSPYESVYIQALGGTYIAIGAFFGVYELFGAIAGIRGGYICDSYGRRKIVVAGNYVTALIWFFIAMAPNWQFYFAAKVLMSIAAFWTVAEWVTLMDSMPVDKRGLGYALFSTMTGIVGLASPYIGGWIFDTYRIQGMRLVLFSVVAADLTKALLYTRGLRETLKPRKEKKAVTLGFKSVFSLVARSFAETFKNLKWMPPSLLGFCALNVVYWFAWSLAGPFFVFYALEVVSLTKVEWGVISMIELAISLCLRFLGGRLADRYSKRSAVLISCAIEVPLFIGFICSRRYLQVLAVFILSTAFETLTGPAWDALQTDLMPRDRRGKVLSLFRIMGAFSGLFGSLLGGYLYTLNAALPFWVYVFLAIAGTSIAFMVIHEPEKPET